MEWRSFAKRNEENINKWKNKNNDFINSTQYNKFFDTNLDDD